MRLYERTDGTIAGTQAEAGKGFTQIEVPTDKAGLIDYLNGLGLAPAKFMQPDPVLPEPVILRDPAGIVPDVQLKPAPQFPTAKGRMLLQIGRELDQVTEWIGTTTGWQLDRLAGAVIDRLTELRRGLT